MIRKIKIKFSSTCLDFLPNQGRWLHGHGKGETWFYVTLEIFKPFSNCHGKFIGWSNKLNFKKKKKNFIVSIENENHAQTHKSQPYSKIIQVIWAIVYRLKRHIESRFTFTMATESSTLIWVVWLRRKCEKGKENFILFLVICIYVVVKRKFYRVIFHPQQFYNKF